MTMSKIVVVGSINIDIVNYVDRLPTPGETIHSRNTQFNPGGKGANQAVAAVRSGGDVFMIGAVGNDTFGQPIMEGLHAYGIRVDHISVEPGHTGMANITVDDLGENVIVLTGGANHSIRSAKVTEALRTLNDVGVLLCQNEIPWEVTRHTIFEANQRGIRVILNPAPAREVPDEVLCKIDTIVLNETEATTITGVTVGSAADAKRAGRILLERGVGKAIFTLGNQGSLHIHKDECTYTPAFKVNVIDSTAGGDTFIGAYALESMTGVGERGALLFATAAAAIAVSRPGALDSIPRRAEVIAFLENHCNEIEQVVTYERVSTQGKT